MATIASKRPKTTEELTTIARRLGWAVTPSLFAEHGASVLFSKYSPAGQDFNFEIDADNLIADLRRYISDFSETKRAYMWLNGRGSTSDKPIDIYKDLAACKKMMRELLNEWEKE